LDPVRGGFPKAGGCGLGRVSDPFVGSLEPLGRSFWPFLLSS
jgi:hypothetical protein